MKQHFLQSPKWQKYEELEGRQTFRLEGKNFSALAVLQTTPLGNYLYCPYGPTIHADKSTNPTLPLIDALDALKKLAKEQSAFFIRIEPTFPLNGTDVKALHLCKSHDLNPAHTWVIDITQPRDQILKQMRESSVQYWRSAPKKGLTIHQTTDPRQITILTNLLASVAAKDNFTPQSTEHLKNQLKSGFATLYYAKYQGKILAASLVYDDDDTRFYAHAATSDEERKLNAGIVLLVQMILDAKDRGAKTFDFWGITTSDDPKHPWYGFTKFKKSFGGHEVDYAGTYDLPCSQAKYQAYRLIRQINRFKRKLLH